MKRFLVMFVCTGNLCRSPMAEGILKNLVLDEVESRHILFPIDVFSAGIHAEEGLHAARHAVEAAAVHGISLQFHRSRQITGAAARAANLILTMENRHSEYIHHHWADVGNVHELKRYGREEMFQPGEADVLDPMGYGAETYRQVFDELREEVTRISRILFPLVREKYTVS